MLFAKETPWRRLEGMTFGMFSTEEIRKLSVKNITNSRFLDNVGNVAPNGLYDLALGPADNKEVCGTCCQDFNSCPGHFGHVELPLPVYNPLFFDKLFLLIRGSCVLCHTLSCPRGPIHLLVNQLQLLDHGALPEVYQLEQILNQYMETHPKAPGDEIEKTLREFAEEVLSKERQPNTKPIKHIVHLKNCLINDFWKNYMKGRVCPRCKCGKFSVRREHNSKIIINLPGGTDDLVSGKRSYLTASTAREHVQLLWEKEGFFLKHLFSGIDFNSSESGFFLDLFFLELLLVPPCRFRPINRMGDQMFTNGQTVNMQAVMKDCEVIRKLLALIAGKKLQEEVSSETPEQQTQQEASDQTFLQTLQGQTLNDKLYNIWIRLQSHVNIVFDSDMDKLMTEKYPGIKQVQRLLSISFHLSIPGIFNQ